MKLNEGLLWLAIVAGFIFTWRMIVKNRDEVDAEIGEVEQVVGAVVTHVSELEAIEKALQAKLDAGAPPADFQVEFDRLAAARQKLADAAQSAAPSP